MLNFTQIRYWKIVRGMYESLLSAMDAWRTDGQCHTVCFCDGNGLPRAWGADRELRAAYANADAVCADGIATDWLVGISGGTSGRIIGPKLFLSALEYGVSRGWRHYFYGADAAALKTLKEKMEMRYPGVRIVGTYAPEFADDPSVPEELRAKGGERSTDFLWVALGCPKQEKWCARHKDEVGASVLLAVGAAFDFLSGKVPEPPEWVHRVGLCWLWRLLTGGRRVFFRNVRCVSSSLYVLAKEAIRIKILRKKVF